MDTTDTRSGRSGGGGPSTEVLPEPVCRGKVPSPPRRGCPFPCVSSTPALPDNPSSCLRKPLRLSQRTTRGTKPNSTVYKTPGRRTDVKDRLGYHPVFTLSPHTHTHVQRNWVWCIPLRYFLNKLDNPNTEGPGPVFPKTRYGLRVVLGNRVP